MTVEAVEACRAIDNGIGYCIGYEDQVQIKVALRSREGELHLRAMTPESVVRVAQTAAMKAEKTIAALAYQDTLTQAGKVSRRHGQQNAIASCPTAMHGA